MMSKRRLAMRTCELLCAMLLGLIPTDAVRHENARGGTSAFVGLELPGLLRRIGVTRGMRSAPSINVSPCRFPSACRMKRLSLSMAANGYNSNDVEGKKKILVTGGAGYIGSHLCVDLLENGYDVVVLDNFMNSSPTSITRVEQITGRRMSVHECDTRDLKGLSRVFDSEATISGVVHLAGLKAVGESVAKPNLYYDNNVGGSINLAKVMADYGCKNLVFSSSATVYGDARNSPIKESHPLSAASPYGRSKLIVEDMLRDTCNADPDWGVVILRYFNPVGSHRSGLIGEDPKGIPNNLMPFITKVAIGQQKELVVFGSDYPTPDGTGVRDYLHISDLSRGHLQALRRLESAAGRGAEVFNLGTGNGVSVLQMVQTFEATNNVPVPHRISGRRPGDVAICYADPTKAETELGWRAERGLDDMCRDVWRWSTANPHGYDLLPYVPRRAARAPDPAPAPAPPGPPLAVPPPPGPPVTPGVCAGWYEPTLLAGAGI